MMLLVFDRCRLTQLVDSRTTFVARVVLTAGFGSDDKNNKFIKDVNTKMRKPHHRFFWAWQTTQVHLRCENASYRPTRGVYHTYNIHVKTYRLRVRFLPLPVTRNRFAILLFVLMVCLPRTGNSCANDNSCCAGCLHHEDDDDDDDDAAVVAGFAKRFPLLATAVQNWGRRPHKVADCFQSKPSMVLL